MSLSPFLKLLKTSSRVADLTYREDEPQQSPGSQVLRQETGLNALVRENHNAPRLARAEPIPLKVVNKHVLAVMLIWYVLQNLLDARTGAPVVAPVVADGDVRQGLRAKDLRAHISNFLGHCGAKEERLAPVLRVGHVPAR
eukprot:CAMPEP_0195034794 /NCGR_PEP_ID=MMETSP0326_2-20130528/68642_1 /TAXON_ID=2866 ORGANISM="Crypthecodinium cohnii, Strain Seligo" /NCGR_SAMPLE_ID=MMETSP0326_2 /ASSEMBLY_ACC=CAM_ASM_000348 /LENGTH=140 /DNA_ID=CAMNT_0040059731 /DNA_START=293 /DNA_END=717 /DNA_ORIENTATION=+